MKTIDLKIIVLSTALAVVLLAACGTGQPSTADETSTRAAEPTSQPTTASATEMIKATRPPPTPLPTVSERRRNWIFDQVWSLIQDRYIYPDLRGVDWDGVREEYETKVAAATQPEIFYGLIDEMVSQLGDVNSYYVSPGEAETLRIFHEGESFGGIGCQIIKVKTGFAVFPILDGPAARGGMSPGDVIVSVNGIPSSDLNDLEFTTMVIGRIGTPVDLTVRSPDGTQKEVTIIREKIVMRGIDVSGKVIADTRIGYLKIGSFVYKEIPQLVQNELEDLFVTNQLNGLIVDLRNNLAGSYEPTMDTLALFMDGGLIGYDVSRSESLEVEVPIGKTLPALKDLPVAVLISPLTSGTAEIFAAGMQMHARATIVGMQSGGYTSSASSHDFADGSELYITESVFKLPDGSLIEGQGVHPDVIVMPDWDTLGGGNDPQIQAAIDVLTP
jgi:carboxyl-terminal processing protease